MPSVVVARRRVRAPLRDASGDASGRVSRRDVLRLGASDGRCGRCGGGMGGVVGGGGGVRRARPGRRVRGGMQRGAGRALIDRQQRRRGGGERGLLVLGRYREIWGDMGRYGEIWGDVGRCGEM